MTNSDVAAPAPAASTNPTNQPPQVGSVALVGAGPGDPGLLTLRGAQLLAAADVVVYDALANPQMLQHCRPEAERIYVGKRAAAHAMPQEQINALLVQQAQLRRRVVRLKGGDPFVFGRGGEECEALAAAGVAFEVVPGITAAIAAPAYAGIPVTHRDFNSSFTLVTGHEKEESLREPEAQGRAAGTASDLDWSVLAKLPCLAFYMGAKSLPRIVGQLIEHGMAADTPAATIHRGSSPLQRTVTAALRDLPAAVAAAKLGPPALTIIGRVVKLRDTLNWFERRPLFGQTVIVTRSRTQASDLARRLAELGANVLEQPTIELAPPADGGEKIIRTFRELAAGEAVFDWIIFTSPNGVLHARRQLLELGADVRSFGRAMVAAVGDATAAAVREHLMLSVHLRPPQATTDSLANTLEIQGAVRGQRFLLLRADIARPALVDRLTAGGAAEVRDVAIYENRPVAEPGAHVLAALSSNSVNWITFTSSSTVTNFLAMLGDAARQSLANVRLASIGPMTSGTLRAAGYEPLEASTHDIDGLIAAVLQAQR